MQLRFPVRRPMQVVAAEDRSATTNADRHKQGHHANLHEALHGPDLRVSEGSVPQPDRLEEPYRPGHHAADKQP